MLPHASTDGTCWRRELGLGNYRGVTEHGTESNVGPWNLDRCQAINIDELDVCHLNFMSACWIAGIDESCVARQGG